MRPIALLLAASLAASAALRIDLDERIETTLARKSAEPQWIESIIAQALAEIEQSCGRRLTPAPPGPMADRFRSIAQQLLRPSGRSAIDVQFLDCGRGMTAVTLGAIIVVNSSWLARASEDDLWAVAAHEMAHRPSDFARRVVIGLHVPGLDAATRDHLVTELEMKADAGALFLLNSGGRNSTALRRFLEQENRATPSPQLRKRLSAL